MIVNAMTQLENLLESSEFIHLARIEDAEEKSSRVLLSLRRQGHAERVSGSTLEEALAELLHPRLRKCSRCSVRKPLKEFPRATVTKYRPEGRHSHCLECDRKRKRGKYLRSTKRKPISPQRTQRNAEE